MITSHYMRDIEVLAKRVLIIKQGVILHDTPIDVLLKQFNHSQKVYFATKRETEFNLPLPYEKISPQEYSITCPPEDLRWIVSEIASHVPLISMRTEETSLEDALFSIFEEKKGA